MSRELFEVSGSFLGTIHLDDKEEAERICNEENSHKANNCTITKFIEYSAYEGLGKDFERLHTEFTNLINDGANLYLNKEIKSLKTQLKIAVEALEMLLKYPNVDRTLTDSKARMALSAIEKAGE